MSLADLHHLARGPAPRLAYRETEGKGPVRVFLHGFHSDMGGTKAAHLHQLADAEGRAFLRFDMSGHGASEGAFETGTISAWRQDALDMLDARVSAACVLVGSSMGGWIALLAALARPERVKGLVLVAPAPDFTERLIWPELSAEAQRQIEEEGQWLRPSAYGDAPYPITRALIEDGRNHLLLDGPIPVRCPVRILHGQADADVPWPLSLELSERLESEDVRLSFIKSGDHRLSTPADLALLAATVEEVASLPGDAA
jgi:pimeloyl-ACP methyl ester carboxylesterase